MPSRRITPQQSRRSRRWLLAAPLLVSLPLALFLDVCAAPASGEPSRCRGHVGAGVLEHGWKLPRNGVNFASYSDLGWALGRTYVHSDVHAVVLGAYQELQEQAPQLRFLYGETGWRQGGRFRPHRTHQTGSSVDFMVPLRDARGRPALLPTAAHNQWGYAIDFDAAGRWNGHQIDFEAVARHLAALATEAQRRKIPIVKVVFYPPFTRKLRSTSSWPRIAALPFTRRESWVRHDDHYHVDFGVRCQNQR